MLRWKSRPLGSLVMWKRLSGPGWTWSSWKATSLSVWLRGLMRYQLSTKLLGTLERLQVKVALSPSCTVSCAGEKVRGLQGLSGESVGEDQKPVREGRGDGGPDPSPQLPQLQGLCLQALQLLAHPQGYGAHVSPGNSMVG